MKKLSESVWGDVRRRAEGHTERREDDMTNIRDIVPLDMGCSVLWADRDLEWKNGSCYFNFDEATELVKKSEWRIPSKDEVFELFKKTRDIKRTDEVCVLVKVSDYSRRDYDDVIKIVFDKKGYVPGDSEHILSKATYYSWTSTPTETAETYFANSIQQWQYFAPMHDMNKPCVRLVKDK